MRLPRRKNKKSKTTKKSAERADFFIFQTMFVAVSQKTTLPCRLFLELIEFSPYAVKIFCLR